MLLTHGLFLIPLFVVDSCSVLVMFCSAVRRVLSCFSIISMMLLYFNDCVIAVVCLQMVSLPGGFVSLSDHRNLKFGPYITSIASKPKAHTVTVWALGFEAIEVIYGPNLKLQWYVVRDLWRFLFIHEPTCFWTFWWCFINKLNTSKNATFTVQPYSRFNAILSF